MAKSKTITTIYDTKIYGVYYYYQKEFEGVVMWQDWNQCHSIPGFSNLFFEASVLKEYQNKKDVLKIKFKNGVCKYFTLSYPWFTWDKVRWKRIKNYKFPDAFWKVYLNLKQT